MKIKGKDLPTSFIRLWNKTMKKAFGEDKPLKYKDRSEFSKDLFFTIKDKDKIVSMGRLIPMKIEFDKKTYNILGLADIVSLIKKKGYGKMLLREMKKYSKDKTVIGFCDKVNEGFYKKSGFNIKRGISKRFVYTDSKGNIFKDQEGDSTVYIEGKNELIKKILSKPKLNISIPIMPW